MGLIARMWISQKKVLAILSLFLFFSRLSASKADESTGRLLMAAMGDSITAASLADIPFPHSDPQQLIEQSLKPEAIEENKENFSWASGRFLPSHFTLLKKELSARGEQRPLDVLNVAVPRSTTLQIEKQAQKIYDAMASGKYDALKYVAIFIGSNDACSKETPIGTPLEQMKKHLRDALTILSRIRQAEPIHVLVIGIPRLPNLGIRTFRDATTIFGLTCETVRNKILHFCDPLLLWNTPEEYEQRMKIVEDKNHLLQDLSQEVGRTMTNLDIVYTDRLHQLEIPIDTLAVDCFHPSLAGQVRISTETWKDQPWFKH